MGHTVAPVDPRTADSPLAGHLARLEQLLLLQGLQWERLVLVDEPLPGDETRLDATALPPEEFEPTWRAIVAEGTRDWVNLSAVGVRAEELLVAVEHVREPLDGRRFRPESISVNLSGPSHG